MSEHTPLEHERDSITKRLQIGDLRVYATMGFYPDGRPGEVFIRAAKIGSTENGLLSTVSILISMSLQNGIPMVRIIDKLKGHSFEPSGFTGDKKIQSASSVIDYLVRWIEIVMKERNVNYVEPMPIICQFCGAGRIHKKL